MPSQIEKHSGRQDCRPDIHSDNGNFENQVGIHAAPSGDGQRYSGDFNPGDFSHSLMCEPVQLGEPWGGLLREQVHGEGVRLLRGGAVLLRQGVLRGRLSV